MHIQKKYLFFALLIMFCRFSTANVNAANDCSGLTNFPAPPKDGQAITIDAATGKLTVPPQPTIPIIQGDGIGDEVSKALMRLLDAAVTKAYDGSRKIHWYPIPAGLEGFKKHGDYLPSQTVDAIRKFVVAMKGPLETPVGGGIRSINVALRKIFDLYACVRPVRYFTNVPSPLKRPEDVNLVIFRENIEDLYAGIEFAQGSTEAEALHAFLNILVRARDGENAQLLPDRDFSFGIKPISEFGSKRIMRRAISYALAHGLPTVTIVHKANIMKETDGNFRRSAYAVATEEFRSQIITEQELADANWQNPEGKLVINDRIADNMFQQALLRPKNYSVVVTENFVGDLFSDSAAAMVGGLGIAPGGNFGDSGAIFEATHGTAPDIAGKDLANPLSIVLSGMMMLEYMGWPEASAILESAITKGFAEGVATGDMKAIPNARILGTTAYADYLIQSLSDR